MSIRSKIKNFRNYEGSKNYEMIYRFETRRITIDTYEKWN